MARYVKGYKGTLVEKASELLEATDLTNDAIFFATGIPTGWIAKFRQGNTADPSVNRVQCLYEFLSDKILEV